MIKTNRRGSILLQVLIMGVVVSTIAAGLMKMVMMNYIVVDKATKGSQNRKEAESILNGALSDWNRDGVCSDFPGYSCGGGPPCTCNGNAAAGSAVSPRIVVTGASAPHTITIDSSDPQ